MIDAAKEAREAKDSKESTGGAGPRSLPATTPASSNGNTAANQPEVADPDRWFERAAETALFLFG